MRLICPHCKKKFVAQSAIVRPSKESYKWYEFTGNHSFCPVCKGRYQTDITPIGAILFVLVIAMAYLAGEYKNQLYGIPIVIIFVLLFLKFPKWFLKVEAK